MREKFETAIVGLLQTVLERIDDLESRITAKGGGAAKEDDTPTWTPKDVERRFGISIRQQYNLRASGVLPFIRKTPKGPVSYLPADVLDYIFSDYGDMTVKITNNIQ